MPSDVGFQRERRQELTEKLSQKVAQLEAALADKEKKESCLRQTMEDIVRAEKSLEENNKVLVRQNQEIQNFYHTVSHELKTPLTATREFVSIVLDGLAGPLNDTQREYLNIAKESCNRLGVCINDLMDATRLETGKLTLDIKPRSLDALVRETVTVMGPVAARKQIRLCGETQPDLPAFSFDKNRLMQVVGNLVNNALKFTPAGGVVTITAEEAADNLGYFRVCVEDNGPGIPAADLENIFERLYQVDTPQQSSQQGVGLGLYICRELVESHGGKIWVESELGRGSTFCFIIPCSQSTAKARLLVVDDDLQTRELLQRNLVLANFQVATADNGESAIEEMKRGLPDLVIMDLEMPVKDGAATLEIIRGTWGLLPVIILTGHVHESIVSRAMKFSPFTLLAKPCPMEQLVETICCLLPQKCPAPQKFNNSAAHRSRSKTCNQ